MYLRTLSMTRENVLACLLLKLDKSLSIREIARQVRQDYKIVFTTAKALEKEKLITSQRVSHSNQCKVALLTGNASLFGWIAQRSSAKRLPQHIWIALTEVVSSITDTIFIMLVFGSYAKATATKNSDIDVLFIVQSHEWDSNLIVAVKRAAALNNMKINPVILTTLEFKKSIDEESVASEAYKNHIIIKGGELFYGLISNA